MEMEQTLLSYLTWSKSSSGYYLFDPMTEPIKIKDLKVDTVVRYTGNVYECIHVFMSRNLMFTTIHNHYFENRICVEKNHLERVRQTFNAKSVMAHEIILRTEIKKVDGIEVTDSLEYYPHDSLYAIKRKSFTKEEALNRNIIKTLKQLGIEDDGSDPF